MSVYGGERITLQEGRRRILQTVEVIGGARGIERIALNTFRYARASDGCVVTRLYNTDITIACPDGTIILNTDGHLTKTTSERINEVLGELGAPFVVGSERRTWYIWRGDVPREKRKSTRVPFVDGMMIRPDGTIGLPEGAEATLEARAEVAQKIQGYLRRVQEVLTAEWPTPDSGDCWFCLFVDTKTGRTWGDSSGDFEHLFSHVEEGYVPGALLLAAYKEAGASPLAFEHDRRAKNVKRAVHVLKRYLWKRLVR